MWKGGNGGHARTRGVFLGSPWGAMAILATWTLEMSTLTVSPGTLASVCLRGPSCRLQPSGPRRQRWADASTGNFAMRIAALLVHATGVRVCLSHHSIHLCLVQRKPRKPRPRDQIAERVHVPWKGWCRGLICRLQNGARRPVARVKPFRGWTIELCSTFLRGESLRSPPCPNQNQPGLLGCSTGIPGCRQRILNLSHQLNAFARFGTL